MHAPLRDTQRHFEVISRIKITIFAGWYNVLGLGDMIFVKTEQDLGHVFVLIVFILYVVEVLTYFVVQVFLLYSSG